MGASAAASGYEAYPDVELEDVCAERDFIDVAYAVVVGVYDGVCDIGVVTIFDFVAVGEAVVVGIVVGFVGAVDVNFFVVGEAIAVGVEGFICSDVGVGAGIRRRCRQRGLRYRFLRRWRGSRTGGDSL